MSDPNDQFFIETATTNGTAICDITSLAANRIQVSVKDITGTSTVTITVIPNNGDGSTYESVVDGTIPLSAPVTLIIDGRIDSVKAYDGAGTDSFTLVVTKVAYNPGLI